MKKIRPLFEMIRYSLPIRLMIRQLQHHKSVLIFWGILIGIISGAIAKNLGGAYLFLEPEYLGEENFWSVFLVGSALGGFLFAYMITIYINESYRFHFISATQHPFYVLAYNNLLIPLIFILGYYYSFISYHVSVYGGFSWEVGERVGGLTLGILAVFLLSAFYFFAQRSIFSRYGKKLEDGLSHSNKQNKKIILDKARESFKDKQRADCYVLFPFQVRKVNSLMYGDFRSVVKTLRQHHGKQLLVQVFVFALIAVLGLLESRPIFQIPAGASLILILSLFMLIIAAMRFWFRQWGAPTLIIAGLTLVLYTNLDYFKEQNQAIGLDYSVPAVPYSLEALNAIDKEEFYHADREHTLEMLENWKRQYESKYGHLQKPRAVFVSASGGGLRSAYWTFNVLQHIDSVTEGRASDNMRLMTGASGGMFGASYFRELYLRQQKGEEIDPFHPQYRENISQDLLNRVFFKMFTDILLPTRKVEVGCNEYDWETGYSFDHQVGQNMPEFTGRKLGDYAEWEAKGTIPQLILSPTVINQGRQLYISSNPVSYLTRSNQISSRFRTRVKGVEFRRFFENHSPDSLSMISALRMNATFPIILPVVELPTVPSMEIMDAGAVDNFGNQAGLRYLYEFRDWFAENTSGIVFLQIRDNVLNNPIREPYNKHSFSKVFAPLGGGYYSMAQAKDINNDYLLEVVHEWFDGPVEVVPVIYPRELSDEPVSLSWHLTKREKKMIEHSLELPSNQRAFQVLKDLYNPEMIAQAKK
ncbi:MAG: hypothetical protein AAFO96_08550 [Bacteroidota bacterium]